MDGVDVMQAMHGFEASSDKELSLAIGDYVVVRKVNKIWPLFYKCINLGCILCQTSFFAKGEQVKLVERHPNIMNISNNLYMFLNGQKVF